MHPIVFNIPQYDRGMTSSELIANSLGQGLGSGLQRGLEFKYQKMLEAKNLADKEQKFINAGYPEDLAPLMAIATQGGQTELLKDYLEGQRRIKNFPGSQGQLDLSIKTPTLNESTQLDFDKGLTPNERVKREEGRYKTQFKDYQDLDDKIRSNEQEKIRLDRLEELNKSDALPSGLGRVNVNLKTGELLFPAGATPETQEFVKIVNDFLSGAKDTFGARVTNFEVSRYLSRLPSLLNSTEGRTAVLRQMRLLNQINNKYSESLRDVIEEHGGIRKIDIDKAQQIARRRIKDDINDLKKEYTKAEKFEEREQKEQIFDAMPEASQYKGQYLIDEDTGKRYVSDGKMWKEVK